MDALTQWSRADSGTGKLLAGNRLAALVAQLRQWARSPEEDPATPFEQGYDAARRQVLMLLNAER